MSLVMMVKEFLSHRTFLPASQPVDYSQGEMHRVPEEHDRMIGTTRRATFWGTTIVFVHLLTNIAHAAAHLSLKVSLNLGDTAFVVTIILLCPLIAMGFLWTSRARMGLLLLAFSMGGSLLFGLYHHFVAEGPDHVGSHGLGLWAATFTISAYVLLVLEAIGTYASVHFLLREG
jgi:hypothetical protein